jgi:Beta-lactamase enzyme family
LDGVLGVAILDLKTGEKILLNSDEVLPQASSIKIAVLAELYHQAEQTAKGVKGKVSLKGSLKDRRFDFPRQRFGAAVRREAAQTGASGVRPRRSMAASGHSFGAPDGSTAHEGPGPERLRRDIDRVRVRRHPAEGGAVLRWDLDGL